MFAIIWRYEVRDEHRAAFVAAYGPKGDWAQLFNRTDGFRGTELLRAEDGTYLTLDVWRERVAFESFLAEHRADYDALDATTEEWTLSEVRLGEYEVIE